MCVIYIYNIYIMWYIYIHIYIYIYSLFNQHFDFYCHVELLGSLVHTQAGVERRRSRRVKTRCHGVRPKVNHPQALPWVFFWYYNSQFIKSLYLRTFIDIEKNTYTAYTPPFGVSPKKTFNGSTAWPPIQASGWAWVSCWPTSNTTAPKCDETRWRVCWSSVGTTRACWTWRGEDENWRRSTLGEETC